MILIIHPVDPSTKFLMRLQNRIKHSINDGVRIFNIQPNNESKDICINLIGKCRPEDIIIFLGHGSTLGLHGSKGKNYDSIDFVSHIAVVENPQLYYYDEYFINSINCEVLKDKQLICVSCYSNIFGKGIFDKGIVKSVIGFELLPTSYIELLEILPNPNLHLVGIIKGEITWILEKSIVHGYTYNYDFSKIGRLIQFLFQYRIAYYLHSNNRYRYDICHVLYRMKKNMLIKGY